MTKLINIDCVFEEGMDAWLVEVLDGVGNVEKTEDFLDAEFDVEIEKMRKSYESKGYKVEVNLRGE